MTHDPLAHFVSSGMIFHRNNFTLMGVYYLYNRIHPQKFDHFSNFRDYVIHHPISEPNCACLSPYSWHFGQRLPYFGGFSPRRAIEYIDHGIIWRRRVGYTDGRPTLSHAEYGRDRQRTWVYTTGGLRSEPQKANFGEDRGISVIFFSLLSPHFSFLTSVVPPLPVAFPLHSFPSPSFPSLPLPSFSCFPFPTLFSSPSHLVPRHFAPFFFASLPLLPFFPSNEIMLVVI